MPVLGGVRYVGLFHYPSCTDSIKRSLQFMYNFAELNASEGSLFPDIWFVRWNMFAESKNILCVNRPVWIKHYKDNKNTGIVKNHISLTDLNCNTVVSLAIHNTFMTFSKFVCLRGQLYWMKINLLKNYVLLR
jgi:hypothetical protein